MPFATNKSPEQLEAEAMAKVIKLQTTAIKYWERANKIRVYKKKKPEVQTASQNEVLPMMKGIAEATAK